MCDRLYTLFFKFWDRFPHWPLIRVTLGAASIVIAYSLWSLSEVYTTFPPIDKNQLPTDANSGDDINFLRRTIQMRQDIVNIQSAMFFVWIACNYALTLIFFNSLIPIHSSFWMLYFFILYYGNYYYGLPLAFSETPYDYLYFSFFAGHDIRFIFESQITTDLCKLMFGVSYDIIEYLMELFLPWAVWFSWWVEKVAKPIREFIRWLLGW